MSLRQCKYILQMGSENYLKYNKIEIYMTTIHTMISYAHDIYLEMLSFTFILKFKEITSLHQFHYKT